jgi:hypothetical protein
MESTPLADAARAALRGEHLLVRQWAADSVRHRVFWSCIDQPKDLSDDALALAAGLVELMASRAGQAAPEWTARVPEANTPIHFVPATLRRSREASEQAGPEPLRRRRIFAMPGYLEFA